MAIPRTSSKQKAATAVARQPEPVVAGAVALAPAPAPAQYEDELTGRRTAQQVAPLASPLASPQARSWLNLGGPLLSSLGKGALALSAVETCWGILLLALAVVEVSARGIAQRPYLMLALIWLGVVVVVSGVGAQILGRPVYRRGRLNAVRRGLQGFGLTLYALAVHGVAVWGIFVFAANRPDPTLAVVAFTLFAANVLLAGLLSLINTLG